MTEITVRVTSLKRHLYIFKLDPKTPVKALYELVAAKTGLDPIKISLIINGEEMIACDEKPIGGIERDGDELKITFQQIEKYQEIENFEKIKYRFLGFCLGREPTEEEIKLSNTEEVSAALKLIYDGSEECRKCGFVFIPESVTRPSDFKAPVPQVADSGEVINMYLEEMNKLSEIGFKDEKRNYEELVRCKGDVNAASNNLLK